MKLVLDSCVALKTVLPEPDSAIALRLLREFKTGSHELIAPDVFPIEVAHALTRAERQNRIAPPEGWRLWRSMMTDAPDLHPSIPLMPRAFALSSTLRLGDYDCLYLALAEQEGCGLITADARLINSFP